MKKWLVLLALILVTGVYAANDTLCSDTDGGGEHRSDAALKTKGEVKYGITSQFDTCLTSQEGVSANASKWLKEYYCRLDKRESGVYDCTSVSGSTGCENGACVSAGTTSNTTNATTTTTQTQQISSCGNKIVDKAKGENCDPPGSICFGRTSSEYGSCQSDCTCKVSESALRNRQVVCGDSYVDAGEECEVDSDCQSGFVCSSCKCVKTLSQAEIEALKKNASVQKVDVSKEIDEQYKTPELPEVNLTATNFSEDAGIKATSGIANFFKRLFGWIAGLFS